MQVVGILLEWMEWGVSNWMFDRAQEPDSQGFILGSAVDSKIGHHFKVVADRAKRQREFLEMSKQYGSAELAGIVY